MLTIRSAEPKDAASIAAHRVVTSGETPFMARYPEECTRDAEALGVWLQGMAEDAQNFAVTAFDGETVVGDLGIQRIRAHIKIQHRASLGISLQAGVLRLRPWARDAPDRGRAGSGKTDLSRSDLACSRTMVRAIHLYRSLGFEDFGCTPRAFRLKDGTYHDERIMVKFL